MKTSKLHIALYSVDGVFQGYLKSVSVYHQKVTSIQNINESKSYGSIETANKDCELVGALTRGGLSTRIV